MRIPMEFICLVLVVGGLFIGMTGVLGILVGTIDTVALLDMLAGVLAVCLGTRLHTKIQQMY